MYLIVPPDCIPFQCQHRQDVRVNITEQNGDTAKEQQTLGGDACEGCHDMHPAKAAQSAHAHTYRQLHGLRRSRLACSSLSHAGDLQGFSTFAMLD